MLILLKSVSNFETNTEIFGRWSQSWGPALRPPWSQSQSRDQSQTHLWKSCWILEEKDGEYLSTVMKAVKGGFAKTVSY